MSNDLFADASKTPETTDDFLNNMMGFSADTTEASEKAQELIDMYDKAKETRTANHPFQLARIAPNWYGDKEIVIFYHQHNDKTVICPIVFGTESIEETIADSKEVMVRSAAYSITRFDNRNGNIKIGPNESTSKFLTLAFNELETQGLVKPQLSYNESHLKLAGCLIIRPEKDIKASKILAAAVSEMRSAVFTLHSTRNYVAGESDLNYLNYHHVNTSIDLAVDKNVTDILGNPVFAPLKFRLSHHRANALSRGEGKRLTPKIEIDAMLEVRSLRNSERDFYLANNKRVPLMIPQIVVLGMRNCAQEGVLTPPMVADAIGALAQFTPEDMGIVYSQVSEYSKVIDKACTAYDWNNVGIRALLEAKANGAAVHSITPEDPVYLVTNERNPNVSQTENAYAALFGEMELLMDVPQSGEAAAVRNELMSNLAMYHHKLTGRTLGDGDFIGNCGLIPMGTYLRESEGSRERRDIREVFNSISMLGKFHVGTDFTENFERGVGHTLGMRVSNDTKESGDRRFATAYKFIESTLIEDGSFEIESEAVRVRIGRNYLNRLAADLALNNVSYTIKHSGRSTLANLREIALGGASIDTSSLYD